VTVFGAVMLVSALPLILAGMTSWIYALLAKSAKAAHTSHGLGVLSMGLFAAGALLLGIYGGAAVGGVLAVLFARWWWLTRPACECVS
jgi:hypothetical protein